VPLVSLLNEKFDAFSTLHDDLDRQPLWLFHSKIVSCGQLFSHDKNAADLSTSNKDSKDNASPTTNKFI